MGAWGQAWNENDTTMDEIDGMIGERLASVKSLASTMTATVSKGDDFIPESILDKYRSDFMILMNLCNVFDKQFYMGKDEIETLTGTNDMLITYMQELETAVSEGEYESSWVDFFRYSDTVKVELKQLNQWMDSISEG